MMLRNILDYLEDVQKNNAGTEEVNHTGQKKKTTQEKKKMAQQPISL